jgi:hypothetical protein
MITVMKLQEQDLKYIKNLFKGWQQFNSCCRPDTILIYLIDFLFTTT